MLECAKQFSLSCCCLTTLLHITHNETQTAEIFSKRQLKQLTMTRFLCFFILVCIISEIFFFLINFDNCNLKIAFYCLKLNSSSLAQLSLCIYAEAAASESPSEEFTNIVLDAGISLFDGASKITTLLVRECSEYRKSNGKYNDIREEIEKIEKTKEQEQCLKNVNQEMDEMCQTYENLHSIATQNLDKFKNLKQRIAAHASDKAGVNK